MSNSFKKQCVRCLLKEAGKTEAIRIVKDYIAGIPDELAADKKLYESRLSVCKDCKWLYMGTCRKCGAYVEARAYKKDSHCPLGEFMW